MAEGRGQRYHPLVLPSHLLLPLSSPISLLKNATAARNTLLFRELDRIVAALAEANIPVILLKGAALP